MQSESLPTAELLHIQPIWLIRGLLVDCIFERCRQDKSQGFGYIWEVFTTVTHQMMELLLDYPLIEVLRQFTADLLFAQIYEIPVLISNDVRFTFVGGKIT